MTDIDQQTRIAIPLVHTGGIIVAVFIAAFWISGKINTLSGLVLAQQQTDKRLEMLETKLTRIDQRGVRVATQLGVDP